MSVTSCERVLSDEEAAQRCLEHAFRNVSEKALKDVDFADVVAHFTSHRRSLCKLFGEPSQEADTAFREIVLHLANEDRFRTLVERIANWSDSETASVSPGQVRYVARAVRDGANPTYPPFGDHPTPNVAMRFGRPARPTR